MGDSPSPFSSERESSRGRLREGKGEGRGKEEGGGELEARGFGGGEDGMEGVDGTTVVLEASSMAELAVAFGDAGGS